MENILQEIGGKVTAIAMRDIFIFYGTVLSCKVDKLIQLFADIILNGEICELKIFFIFMKFFCYNNIFFLF